MAAVQERTVAVITPWYPTRQGPFAGAFVQDMVAATAPGCDHTAVFYCAGWSSRSTEAEDAAMWQAQRQLLARGAGRGTTVAGAELVYVPVPVLPGITFATAATRYAEAVRIALGGKPIDAAIVHAHVGLRGGWTAVRNARPGARVFVTEHASYIGQVLAEPDSRAMYDEMLGRVDGFFVVGEAVRGPIAEAFPHHADRIGVIPNPISFDYPVKAPGGSLKRWLFLGHLTFAKGVNWLLEAFAECHAEDGELSLTFVGQGAERAMLEARTAELGLTGAVTFTGPVPPEEARRLLGEHDLLVHPSRAETFGMTVVEAVATGIPVLVTRCGGPEESLAGIEDAAGEFIPVEDGADAIVAGYRRLRDRFPGDLDLPYAREVLAGKYSYPSVAQAHYRVWFPEVIGDAARAGAMAPAVNVME